MKCTVSWCDRITPAKMLTYGLCSYHYRVKREGYDPATYMIRKKSKNGTLLESVLEAVNSNEDDCILWQHGKDDKGYGSIVHNGKRYKAHRLVLMMFTNLEPDRHTFACHRCDTPACVNPRHLYWGDHASNVEDMIRHNRAKAYYS